MPRFCSLLAVATAAMPFSLPSAAAFVPSTISPCHEIRGHAVQLFAATSSSKEKIEVEDFEEYARCLSPREVSFSRFVLLRHSTKTRFFAILNSTISSRPLTLSHHNLQPQTHVLLHNFLSPTKTGTQAYPVRIKRICRHRRKAKMAEGAPFPYQANQKDTAKVENQTRRTNSPSLRRIDLECQPDIYRLGGSRPNSRRISRKRARCATVAGSGIQSRRGLYLPSQTRC